MFLSQYDGTSAIRNARKVRLDKIVALRQHRQQFDENSLQELAASMSKQGQLQPIRVRWSREYCKYLVIAGERRFRAAQLNGWDDIDCFVETEELSDSDILEMQIAENLQREDLNPMERAEAFRDYKATTGLSDEGIGQRLGVNQSTISRHLKLLELPAEIQEKVRAGSLGARTALAQATPKPEKPAKQSGKREMKITLDGATITIKQRRILKDGDAETALEAALQKLRPAA